MSESDFVLGSDLPGAKKTACDFPSAFQTNCTKTPPSLVEPVLCRERNSGKQSSGSAYHTHPEGNKMRLPPDLLSPGPGSQFLKWADTICSSPSIRQLAASFLPAFLGTHVALGKAFYVPELLVAHSLP